MSFPATTRVSPTLVATEILKLPHSSSVAITFWGAAGWKMGATLQKRIFNKVYIICQDLRITILLISKNIFSLHPSHHIRTVAWQKMLKGGGHNFLKRLSFWKN